MVKSDVAAENDQACKKENEKEKRYLVEWEKGEGLVSMSWCTRYLDMNRFSPRPCHRLGFDASVVAS